MIFSLERAAVVWAILERILGFDPSLEMIAPRYLKFSTSSTLLPFILISLWKLFGLFVITSVLSRPISILYLVVVVSRRSTTMPASSSSSAFTTMSSAKRKLVISRPPILTLPSWSSNASHIILCRKMLKRVGESRHFCRTPTVLLNHSPVLPLNRTAHWALSYRFLMARMMLALMLYFLVVVHKASCHTLSKAFLKSTKTWSRFCWCCRHFSPRILRLNICSVVLLLAMKPACSSAIISLSCGWSLFRMIFNITLLGWLIRLMVL